MKRLGLDNMRGGVACCDHHLVRVMSPIRDSTGKALSQIRARLRGGTFPPGAPLAISGLAEDLALSPTPIREALARLAGEGLVVERRGLGYFAEVLDAKTLSDVFALHQLYALMALDTGTRRWGEPAARSSVKVFDSDISLAEASEALFDALVANGGNTTLLLAHRRLAGRLGPARTVEHLVLTDTDTELRSIALAFDSHHGDLTRLVETYHARRTRAAGDILAALSARFAA